MLAPFWLAYLLTAKVCSCLPFINIVSYYTINNDYTWYNTCSTRFLEYQLLLSVSLNSNSEIHLSTSTYEAKVQTDYQLVMKHYTFCGL